MHTKTQAYCKLTRISNRREWKGKVCLDLAGIPAIVWTSDFILKLFKVAQLVNDRARTISTHPKYHGEENTKPSVTEKSVSHRRYSLKKKKKEKKTRILFKNWNPIHASLLSYVA